MSDVPALFKKLSGFGGSLAVAAFAFLSSTALNEYRPLDFSRHSIIAGLCYALGAICVIQIEARTRRPLRSYLFLAVGAAVLFYLTCWSAIFDNAHGQYNSTIALLIWGGITTAALVWVIYLERTEYENGNG